MSPSVLCQGVAGETLSIWIFSVMIGSILTWADAAQAARFIHFQWAVYLIVELYSEGAHENIRDGIP